LEERSGRGGRGGRKLSLQVPAIIDFSYIFATFTLATYYLNFFAWQDIMLKVPEV